MLVPLINDRRSKRFLMRLMRYIPAAEYVPKKKKKKKNSSLIPSLNSTNVHKKVTDTHTEVECYVATVTQGSPSRMERIKMVQIDFFSHTSVK